MPSCTTRQGPRHPFTTTHPACTACTSHIFSALAVRSLWSMSVPIRCARVPFPWQEACRRLAPHGCTGQACLRPVRKAHMASPHACLTDRSAHCCHRKRGSPIRRWRMSSAARSMASSRSATAACPSSASWASSWATRWRTPTASSSGRPSSATLPTARRCPPLQLVCAVAVCICV